MIENSEKFQIESIRNSNGDEVSFCPSRGGMITSLILNGKEIFYLDKKTFNNKESVVRGGIPILFPNAGEIPDDMKIGELANLKRHGFAREMTWSVEDDNEEFEEYLSANEDTKRVYPYDFRLSIRGNFEKDNSFTIHQFVENTGERDMPIACGLHPYFKVPNDKKGDIIFDFEGGEYVKNEINKWANGEYISIENPNKPMRVIIPELGTLVLNFSKEYKRVWIWSMSGKDFVCVEPVMNDKGGIITNPEKIKPHETHSSSFNISLKE